MSSLLLDRSRPPTASALEPFSFPPFERYLLPQGLEVLLAPRPGSHLVHLQLRTDAGGQRVSSDTPGLAALTATLLDEGTAARSGPEIAEAIEQLGGSLGTSADWNGAQATVSLLAAHFDTGLALVDEIVRQPTFPLHEVDRLRRQTLTELLRRRDQPAAVAEELLARVLYRGTVYEHPILGLETSVERFARTDLAAFHSTYTRPASSSLIAVGDFDVVVAARLIEGHFTGWQGPAAAAVDPIVPPARGGVSIHIVDRPGAAQTELRMGHASVPRPHPDRPALMVMNSILGGKFTSRINLNLRERHGFTYGASSRFVDRQGPGPFIIGAAVATESTGAAVRETLGELARIRDQPVATAELEDAVSYLIGVFPYTVQTDQDLARRLAELAVYRLPTSHYGDQLAAIRAVSRADIQRVAGEHLHLDALAIVAVGPLTELLPQLGGVGEVQVVPGAA